MLFGQDRTGKPDERGTVRKDTHHVASALQFLVEPLQGIGRVQLLAQCSLGKAIWARTSSSASSREILGTRVDAFERSQALEVVDDLVSGSRSGYVCLCNVHSLIAARSDSSVGRSLNGADLSLPDGAPVAWALRRLGFPGQRRVDGPGFMMDCCGLAQSRGYSVFLYGSTRHVQSRLREALRQRFPDLAIAGSWSPPFCPIGENEDGSVVDRLNGSGADIVLVALGAPKQELWMAAHQGSVGAVMVGVGAAFDFHAGVLSRAPEWMQRCGLEWLHRLVQEPRRLWRRYLVGNAVFIVLFGRDLARSLLNERRGISTS